MCAQAGQLVAVKEIQTIGYSQGQIRAIENEVETMKALRHQNIIKCARAPVFGLCHSCVGTGFVGLNGIWLHFGSEQVPRHTAGRADDLHPHGVRRRRVVAAVFELAWGTERGADCPLYIPNLERVALPSRAQHHASVSGVERSLMPCTSCAEMGRASRQELLTPLCLNVATMLVPTALLASQRHQRRKHSAVNLRSCQTRRLWREQAVRHGLHCIWPCTF